MKLILLFIFVSLSIQIIHHLHRHRLRSKNNRRPLTDSKMNIKMKNKHLKEFYNINDCKMQKYSKSSLSLKILNFNKKGERKFTIPVDFYSDKTQEYCRDIHQENCSELENQTGVYLKQIQEFEHKKFKYELSIYLQFEYDDKDKLCHAMLYDVEESGQQDEMLKFKKKEEPKEEEQKEEGKEADDKKEEKKRASKRNGAVKRRLKSKTVLHKYRYKGHHKNPNRFRKEDEKKDDEKKDGEKKEGEEEEEDKGPTPEEKAEFAKEIKEEQEKNNEECAQQFIDFTNEGQELEELSSDYKDNFVKKYIMQFVKKEEREDFDSKVVCPGNTYFLQKNKKQTNE